MIVVVAGANGLVGSRLCLALVQLGVGVRAVVRRPGKAPAVQGVEEQVGDFANASFAARVLAGADAAISTVHPMGSDAEVQRRIGVVGSTTFAKGPRRNSVGELRRVGWCDPVIPFAVEVVAGEG